MKKYLLLALAALLPLLASAHDFEVEGIYYNIISDTDLTVEVTHKGTHYPHSVEYKGVTTLDIPSTVIYNEVTYKVTGVGEYAFYFCSTLTSVSIPQGVTSIGNGAFVQCSSLASITIPEGIISLGESSFSGCSSLNAITIPNSVKTIGSCAFHSCKKLTAITIPEGVTSIADGTFQYCNNIASVTIPESVTTIGAAAFYDVKEIIFKSTVPPTLSSNIAYSPTVIIVPSEAYSAYCEAELWADMASLLTIDDENVRIREVTLEALDDESSLSAAVGYDKLKFVTNLTINGSINSYDFGVLRDEMPLLRHLDLSKTAIKYNAYEFYKRSHTDDNIFPNYGLYGCKLYTLVFPKSITSIGEYAFCSCSSLSSIAIPGSVTTIGGSAFWGCGNLTSITIPEGVTSIGRSAFYGCRSLESITIPKSLTNIGGSAFYDCEELSSVYISDLAAWCGINFESYDSNPLHQGGHLYLDDQPYTEVVIPDGVTSLSDYVFYSCGNIVSVTMPESVTEIGKEAFAHCEKLSSAIIPNGVTEIRKGTFYRCESLTSISVPEGLTSIGDAAFGDCNFTTFDIPKGVKSIGTEAFAGCRRLTSIDIPEGVTEIKYGTFSVCWALTSMTFPENLSIIDREAFYNCTGLATIILPKNLTEIKPTAFQNCRKLSNIICYATTPPTLGESAFATNVYEEAKLCVPMEALDFYKADVEWSKFFNIVEIETGIHNSEFKTQNSEFIYDLRGHRVENPTKPGIYIGNGSKVVVK